MSGTNGAGSSSTSSRTILSVRSRTPRMYSRSRVSSSASVSALIMPRSATMHTRNGKAAAQAINDRDERCHIGGVARPHLRAHGMAIPIDDDRKDHLAKIRALILAEAVAAERLAARP